jgi:hypothetical protein
MNIPVVPEAVDLDNRSSQEEGPTLMILNLAERKKLNENKTGLRDMFLDLISTNKFLGL